MGTYDSWCPTENDRMGVVRATVYGAPAKSQKDNRWLQKFRVYDAMEKSGCGDLIGRVEESLDSARDHFPWTFFGGEKDAAKAYSSVIPVFARYGLAVEAVEAIASFIEERRTFYGSTKDNIGELAWRDVASSMIEAHNIIVMGIPKVDQRRIEQLALLFKTSDYMDLKHYAFNIITYD